MDVCVNDGLQKIEGWYIKQLQIFENTQLHLVLFNRKKNLQPTFTLLPSEYLILEIVFPF
jgi:hypothetical protein